MPVIIDFRTFDSTCFDRPRDLHGSEMETRQTPHSGQGSNLRQQCQTKNYQHRESPFSRWTCHLCKHHVWLWAVHSLQRCVCKAYPQGAVLRCAPCPQTPEKSF